MDFKDRLKQLREWRRLTQDQLADKAGLGQSTIGNYETGKRFPKLDRELPALAAALSVPVADFFTESSPEQVYPPHALRLDPAMLLVANRETTHLQAIEGDLSEARWAELFANVYPLVVSGAGMLRREDAHALTLASTDRLKSGGAGSGHGKAAEQGRKRRGVSLRAVNGTPEPDNG